MARWLAVLAILLLALVTSASAQGFTVFWVYASDGGNPPLTTTCGGGTPLEDGRVVRVFWDVDSDGPDITDPLAPLCDVPPLCEEGPGGTMNYNEFTVNGTALEMGAGYFYTEYGMDSHGVLPEPPRYYLRIYEPDGLNYLWTSSVETLSAGFQEIYFSFSDWTCGAGGPQCTVRNEQE